MFGQKINQPLYAVIPMLVATVLKSKITLYIVLVLGAWQYRDAEFPLQ